MTQTIAVIAQGAMGSGIARVLTEHGAAVLTSLEGRGLASNARAQAAGMRAATLDEIAACDIILSIVPPGDALALAQRLAPALARADRKAIYVDCNAVNPATVQDIAAVIAVTGAPFVDGGIIGGPPEPQGAQPSLYLSGPDAPLVGSYLTEAGLHAPVMAGGIGAASALKMSYAGITKGLTALAAIMALGAVRAGADQALLAELAISQKPLRARFARGLPDMVPKAYRWVVEMHEIAGFLQDDSAGAMVFEGIAQLYERLAAGRDGAEVKALLDFAGAPVSPETAA